MIGIFDSGVGGLTVVKEVQKRLPGYQILYFGDTARLPYGTKGADFVQKFSSKIAKWLISNGAEIIVIACHTSSAWAGDLLKKKHKNIVFDMISFAAKDVVAKAKNKKVGIIGTPGTIKSGAWNKQLKKLDPSLKIFSKSCSLFVPMVEMGFTSGRLAESIVKEYLKEIKSKKVDVLVLACTHYPLLGKTIKKYMGKNVKIINPAEGTAKEIKKFLLQNKAIAKKIKKGGKQKFTFSDEPYNLEKISHLCFGKKIKAEIKDPF